MIGSTRNLVFAPPAVLTPIGRSLEVDVDWHRMWEQGTACFRGLLCNRCNTIIGYANDDIERLLAVCFAISAVVTC